MKRILALILAFVFILSLAACSPKKAEAKNAKFGLGVYATYVKGSDADGDKNGKAGIEATFAALLVGEDGKIISCKLDATANELAFTSAGEALEASPFKTKREAGDAYGMVAYGNAKLEWYAQADAFEKLVVGKTLDEVKALIASDGKNTDAVTSAGCTITASEFVLAIEKAYNNASLIEGAANGTLGLGIVSTQAKKSNAEGDKKGKVGVDVSVTATVLDANKKAVKAVSDAISVEFAFDTEGKLVENSSKLVTKREAGDAYGMVAYGGAAKEWYAQADEFDAKCAGKTKAELESYLAGDKADLISAGCTIDVIDMAKAAIKALDVK